MEARGNRKPSVLRQSAKRAFEHALKKGSAIFSMSSVVVGQTNMILSGPGGDKQGLSPQPQFATQKKGKRGMAGANEGAQVTRRLSAE